ncbi:hypothetical protein [Comamonas sp. JC664]|uniref:hypothetical protein n=1 Tax=Comamonas sp. JC664 TaxID=2801917 RepID=UPI00174C7C33|nr:hypothetical protein [Comamonas sp. JC664]MBL0692306.1 hypothetical protein [Comamonas sp. JC664]GHG98448.1 hypothetical protein GCM10012319_64170 [Comamonas sp. KCTC 72670]
MRFHAGWLLAGAAALTLGTACQERDHGAQGQAGGQGTVSDQVAQAQQRSEGAFDSARKAQEQASDQQKQAADAQRDLQKRQQELQEAQAKAQSASQQAQQAQQNAQQQTQQAQQEAQQAQAGALEAQRRQSEALTQQNQQARQQSEQLRQQSQQPVAAAPVPGQPQGQGAQQGSEQQVVGEVLSSNDQELLLSARGEPQLRLQVSPQTQVTVDGRQASAADIQEGSQVRASYRTDEQSGEPQAVRIEATSQVQPTAPAAPESGQSTPGAQPTQ